jgi:hypothetical protein
MANSTVPTKSTGDTLSAAELNNIVQAVNSKADQSALTQKADQSGVDTALAQKLDKATATALSGTVWHMDTQPFVELSLSGNTALTTTGTAAVSRGVLLVTNPASYTLTINGTAVTIKNSGECAIGVYYKTSGIYYSSDAGAGASGGSTNTTPAAPTLSADDTANTLSASHALGTSEIVVSENDGVYAAYSGPISVGDVARAEGYWKFKVKSATGRNESAVANSPAFTVVAPADNGTPTPVAAMDASWSPLWTNGSTFAYTNVVGDERSYPFTKGFKFITSNAAWPGVVLEAFMDGVSLGEKTYSGDGSTLWEQHPNTTSAKVFKVRVISVPGGQYAQIRDNDLTVYA